MKSGETFENRLIWPGDNDYGRKPGKKVSYHSHQPNNPAVSLMLQAAKELDRAAERIIELEKQLKWVSIADELPQIGVSVIRANYAVEGHPEWNNQCIDHLTEDCITGEVKWFNDKRKPDAINDCWMILQSPPLKSE